MASHEIQNLDSGIVVRTWTATATVTGAEQYSRYFSDTLLPKLPKIPGFSGAYLLSRPLKNPKTLEGGAEMTIELTTHTFWESIDAIYAFAGPDINVSVVAHEAQACLQDFDRSVVHHNLLVDSRE